MQTAPKDMSTTDEAMTETRLQSEAPRVLRRLSEPRAVMAVAADMEKAVIVRETASGTSTRTAVVDRDLAEALALKGWIHCDAPGRVSRYAMTKSGREAFAKLVAQQENAAQGFAEKPMNFGFGGDPEEARGALDRGRPAMGETPLIALARRRDKEGVRFLSPELVAAGERLREDFELAHLDQADVVMDWERIMAGADHPGCSEGQGYSAAGARRRLVDALRELGPGLGDIVLSCCCRLEGLESAERRMGWSARSGKIVLRIALQRLKRFYETLGSEAGMVY